MAGIGIISNPYSKLNRHNPERPGYLSYIAGRKGHVAVTKTLDELAEVAAYFQKQNISILAINGGDGTISQTLSIFHNVYQDAPFPQIALLRGGTMNVLATNLGIKGSPEQILYRLIEAHSTAEQDLPVSQKHSLMIEGHVGFLFAYGVPAHFLEKFYQNKSGHLGAAWLMGKIVLSRFFNQKFYRTIVRKTPTSLQIDNQTKTWSLGTIAVLISTLPKMPMGPKLFPDMDVSGGFRGQIVAYDTDVLRAATTILWDAMVFPTRESAIKTREVGSSFHLNTETPILYTLDGELYRAQSPDITVKVGRSFDFLCL